jgi:quercetin dioxygenase-like cupin family protein
MSQQNLINIFPVGESAPSEYFTGKVNVKNLVPDDSIFNCAINNVAFEKGARTNWHTHPSGQIILIIDGEGLYQEKGSPIQTFKKGDVVKFNPDVEHWHGASPDSHMTHIAINPNTEKGLVEWLKRVTEEEYTKRTVI